MGTEHAFLGVGHECDKDLVGGHLGFGTYDLQKCFSVGNVSSALEYDEIIYGDPRRSFASLPKPKEPFAFLYESSRFLCALPLIGGFSSRSTLNTCRPHWSSIFSVDR